MTILRKQSALLALVALLMAGDGNSFAARTLHDALPLEGIAFITITNKNFGTDEESWLVKCEDQKLIQIFAVVIRDGKPSQDHRCSDIGTITFHLEQGKTLQFGFLPGHDEDFYQFRMREDDGYSIYQAERSVFLDALKALGCPVNETIFPK